MRLSEVNKEIEKNKKETKMIGIFLAVVFLVAELCFLGTAFSDWQEPNTKGFFDFEEKICDNKLESKNLL